MSHFISKFGNREVCYECEVKENDLNEVPPPVQNVARLIAALVEVLALSSYVFTFSPYPRPPPSDGYFCV